MLFYKKKPFKSLTFYWKKTSAGRNSSGHITSFHRGGGFKKKQRRIDFQRFITNKGQVIRIEYDPCRTAWIALIQWFVECSGRGVNKIDSPLIEPTTAFCGEKEQSLLHLFGNVQSIAKLPEQTSGLLNDVCAAIKFISYFSYVPAWHSLKIGDIINNYDNLVLSTPKNKLLNKIPYLCLSPSSGYKYINILNTMFSSNNINSKYYNQTVMDVADLATSFGPSLTNNLIYKNGNSLFLCNIPVGTRVHNIELAPQKGAQLCRAAGTFAELVEKMENKCLIRLPSGKEQYLDSQCRATIGIVSNSEHELKIFYKAGQNRWHGKRPIVRGVAMNPIDHPHGGGEGKTKGGRPSVSPWGKPCKSGFKTVLRKRKKILDKK